MLWTAPAPRHRSAVDWLSQPERFKEVRQATTVAFEVEGIGEDRRGNADKVDPGIGTTRVGQRIFEMRASDWDPIRAEHYGQRLHGRTNRPDT